MKTAKIIGCGLSGIVSAILLKSQGYKVTIFEKRNHIGGNCYDSNTNGVILHNYGPHVFHTDNEEVFRFLSQYTDWTQFRTMVKGNTRLGLISLPYSRQTILELGRGLSKEEIIEYIFREYSEKQWGVPLSDIPPEILNRVPQISQLDNPTWFGEQRYQCIPKFGYTKMFENMIVGFDIVLCCDNQMWTNYNTDLTVYTGKIDEYFDFCYGRLPYRSLSFIHEVSSNKLPFFIQNENNNNVTYTRIYDHSYFTPCHGGQTIITKEFPKECGKNDIPFYPIPFKKNLLLYHKYKELSIKKHNVIFLGRLATYKYMDMWKVVEQALSKFQ